MEITFEISVEDFEGSTELERAKMTIQIQGPRSKKFEVWTQGNWMTKEVSTHSYTL